ncbi:MAG: mechanosensitive ion channel family protein [Candidatus Micrarchaeia archaeon]|jgi:MscS family membrane protein
MDALTYVGYLAGLFIISLAVGGISGPVIVKVLEFFSGKTKSTLDDRIIAAIKVPLESCFFIIVFYLLLHAVPELSEAAKFLESYTVAIIIVIGTFMLSEASGAAIRWYYEEGHKSARVMKVDLSLLPLVRKVTKLAIYAIGLTLALSTTGFDVTGILAVTSVVGLILGLASQETLANIFAGIALQLDRPYHYGDCLKLSSGEIAKLDKIGMRTTRLTDVWHNTIIISNSEFAKLRVTNLSLPDDISVVAVQAELPLETDFDALKKHISAALSAAKPKGLLPDLGYALSIDAIRPASASFSFSFWVKDYENAEGIRQMVNRAMLGFARRKKKKQQDSFSEVAPAGATRKKKK